MDDKSCLAVSLLAGGDGAPPASSVSWARWMLIRANRDSDVSLADSEKTEGAVLLSMGRLKVEQTAEGYDRRLCT